MVRRRACDRCHQLRQRCNVNVLVQKCGGCAQAGHECKSTRSRPRQGRQPKVQHFDPNHIVQVWDLDKEDRCSVPQPSSNDTLESKIATPNTTTTCDDAKSCVSARDEPTLSSDMKALFLAIHSSTRRFKYHKEPLFDPDTPEVLQRFFSHYEIFMLGPSFATELRSSVKKLYASSPELLHDIIFELEHALPTIPSASGPDEVDFTTGSTSIQDLRTTAATCCEHAFAIVGLGQILAAFDLMTSCNGVEAILKSSILSVGPWAERLFADTLSASVMVVSIFWDVLCCLLREEVPATRYEPNGESAHRMAGFCTPLIPIFYDLCVASVAIRRQRSEASTIDTRSLDEIRERVQTWSPIQQPYACTTFSHDELVKLETQALMYKDAALLLCHRFSYPYGTADEVADQLASSIVRCFQTGIQALEGKTKLNFVAFPLLLAALETEALPVDVWQDIALAAVTPVWMDKIGVFVQYVWHERRSGRRRYLMDLIREGPAFVIIP